MTGREGIKIAKIIPQNSLILRCFYPNLFKDQTLDTAAIHSLLIRNSSSNLNSK
jgi:hypothetical protein